jgi:hypothetical protein
VEVRQYKQGTLIIDLIDASTKELVWRGVGKSEITNEDREEQIKQVVSDILAKYPPAE